MNLLSTQFIFIIPLICVIISLSLIYYPKEETIDVSSRDGDLYTRGKMHYLSMDFGMSSCWNETVKKYLFLSCPLIDGVLIDHDPDLEVELAYLITSCFCESIGEPKLSCRKREGDEVLYTHTLIGCGSSKCYNGFKKDSFAINYDRMPDLCHYLVQKNLKSPLELNMAVGGGELERLRKISLGEGYEGYRTPLYMLRDLVNNEVKIRNSGIAKDIGDIFDHILHILDDICFKLRIGKYYHVPFY